MDAAALGKLRARVAAIEGIPPEPVGGIVRLGVADIDGALPWGGLPLGCLHEVAALPSPTPDGAPDGFAAHLLGRLAETRRKPVLWVAANDDLYAPGLAGLGLPASRLVVVRPRKPSQALWALEEAVHCKGLAGVLGDIRALDFTAARRLQLAARESGTTALVLNRGASVGTAVTRWRVGALPSLEPAGLGVGTWRWRVELVRCRGRGLAEDAASAWEVEWDDATRGLRLAAAAGDRGIAASWRAAG